MNNHLEGRRYRIGVYIRESRDDGDENIETIETQRALLLDYASRVIPGEVFSVYEDDNVSGSAFERPGLDRLKKDVTAGRVDMLLVKDLSRIGRNNARTLLFMDFLEEKGVRLVTFDGRYDSLRDNETAGLETWINERYVRDISRKIKASLRFKIESGEYVGHAPFGYAKSNPGENRLFIDENTAPTVRLIYRLYRSGLGYSSIAARLGREGYSAPGRGSWNRTAVRRILCSRVYTGDTVQGTSERISFKSRKSRRLPEEKWVITENTHEAIIGREEYALAQEIRLGKARPNLPHKRELHPLRGLVYCGECGSVMYARKKGGSNTVYICSNYFKNGRKACSSHLVKEASIIGPVVKELVEAFRAPGLAGKFKKMSGKEKLPAEDISAMAERNSRQLSQKLRQQELLYGDRLEGRISEQLFARMNRQLEEKMERLRQEAARLASQGREAPGFEEHIKGMIKVIESGIIPGEILRQALVRITVYDDLILIDFAMNKV